MSIMKSKKNKQLNKFLLDDSFVRWIKYGNDKNWDNWKASYPGSKEITDDARQVISSMQFKEDFPSNEQVELLKNNIDENILLHKVDSGSGWSVWAWRAAILVFILICVTVVLKLSDSEPPVTRQAYELIEKSTHSGQKLTTNLPDGSKVILNNNTKLSYQLPFTEAERVIHLEGEAFFEVAEDTARPFKVVSSGIITTALGTSFNVNNKRQQKVDISLVTGKVSVENKLGQRIVLHPGNKVVASSTDLLQSEQFDHEEELGWKDGLLVFRDSSFPEIIEKLEEWYGVEVESKLNLTGDIRYSGNYKNESLEEVLQGISFIYHFKYKINVEENRVEVYD